MPDINPRWTKEQLDLATELWLAGHPAREIAPAVGKTRSAVVGKMKRLGLLCKDAGMSTIAAKNVKQPTQEPAPIAVSLHPVTLKKLKPHHYRAILGDVGREGFAMYCGDPKAEGSSYCAFHHGLYTQPPNEKARHGQTGQRK